MGGCPPMLGRQLWLVQEAKEGTGGESRARGLPGRVLFLLVTFVPGEEKKAAHHRVPHCE